MSKIQICLLPAPALESLRVLLIDIPFAGSMELHYFQLFFTH